MIASLGPPKTALMTAEEFAEKYPNHYAELVDGAVLELPMPQQEHGSINFEVAFAIGGFVKANDLGRVTTHDSFVVVRRDPDTVRGADLCYFSWDRLPRGPFPKGLIPNIPDLVVEVISPTDRWKAALGKALEYIEAGVRLVVILDEKTRSATLIRPDEVPQKVDNGDDLVMEDILPGFRVPIRTFFEV